MAADQINLRVHNGAHGDETQPMNTTNRSPSEQMKRRKRSPMSPDRDISRAKSSGSRSSGYRSPSPGSRILVTDMNEQMRYPSAHSSASASASISGTATGGSSSSRNGGGGEDALTLRRREANRLAAQRFRSRKKGYQDSLEDRIRILEEEKDSISQRLVHSHQRSPHDEGFLRHHDMYRRRSGSPDNKNLDADVRVAALESANRRLQDELRGVVEDNERLRDEVDRWRKWDRDMRETRRDDDRVSTISRNAVAMSKGVPDVNSITETPLPCRLLSLNTWRLPRTLRHRTPRPILHLLMPHIHL